MLTVSSDAKQREIFMQQSSLNKHTRLVLTSFLSIIVLFLRWIFATFFLAARFFCVLFCILFTNAWSPLASLYWLICTGLWLVFDLLIFCFTSTWPAKHDGVIVWVRFWQATCQCWRNECLISCKCFITCLIMCKFCRCKCFIMCKWLSIRRWMTC